MVTALSSRRFLLIVEIVEVVEEIVKRVVAEITSCSTVVTAQCSRGLLLVEEIVVEEIVERVAAEITSWSTVVTALTTELSTWLPRTLQLVLARARLGPTTLPKKYKK